MWLTYHCPADQHIPQVVPLLLPPGILYRIADTLLINSPYLLDRISLYAVQLQAKTQPL